MGNQNNVTFPETFPTFYVLVTIKHHCPAYCLIANATFNMSYVSVPVYKDCYKTLHKCAIPKQ